MVVRLFYGLFFLGNCLWANAQETNLAVGDIAIIAFQSDNNDQFAFVTLVDIAAATKIQFSEKGWNGSIAIPAFVVTTEGVHTWTAPTSGVSKGTVVTIDFNSTGLNPVASAGTVVSSSAAKLSTAGDQLIAYQGAASSPVFLYAFSSQPWISSGSPTSTQSWLPSGLTNGISARDFTTETDNQYFNTLNFSGSRDSLLSAIGNGANWARSNTRYSNLPTWNFMLLKTYYSNANGSLSDLSTWGITKDGTGTAPTTFLDSNSIYRITNRSGKQNLTANWVTTNLSIDSSILLTINGFSLTLSSICPESLGQLSGSNASQLSIAGNLGQLRIDSLTSVLKSLNLAKKASLMLIRPLEIMGNNAAGTVTLGDSAVLTSNGNLVLRASANGFAAIDALGKGASIIGDVQVQQYIPGGKRNFRFLAHPFSTSIGLTGLVKSIDITGIGGASNGFTNTVTNNASAFWYNPFLGDGSSNDLGWIAFTNTNGQGSNTWKKQQGIRINIRGNKGEGLDGKAYTPSPILLQLSGQLNTGNQVIYLSKGANNAGFNLIGNPYAASIDMNKLSIGSNVNPNFYIWNPHQGNKGGYTSYPFSSGISLPPLSAFFVQTTDTSSGNYIQFTEQAKTNASNVATVFGSENKSTNQLEFLLESDSVFWDKQLFLFQQQRNNELEKFNAEKLLNPDLNFYSLNSEGKKLSIDNRAINSSMIIPLAIETNLEKTFLLKAIQTPIVAGIDFYLYDYYTNKELPISADFQYSFTTSATGNIIGTHRFEIRTKTNISEPITTISTFLKVQIYPNPTHDNLTIKFNSAKQLPLQIRLLNSNGLTLQIVDFGSIQNGITAISLNGLRAGIYYLDVSNSEEKNIQKIIKH